MSVPLSRYLGSAPASNDRLEEARVQGISSRRSGQKGRGEGVSDASGSIVRALIARDRQLTIWALCRNFAKPVSRAGET